MTIRPIKGDPARRYVDTETGRTMSRRAGMKILQGVSPEELRVIRAEAGYKTHMGRYNAIVRDYRKANPGAKVRGRGSEKFKEVVAALKTDDNSPTGRKARALEQLGRRAKNYEDWYPVGDSPE